MEWLTSPQFWAWLAAVLLIAVGVAGTVLPALPGVVLVLAGMVLGAWIDGFVHISGWTLGVIAVLAALAWATDFVAGVLGAKKAGASRAAVIGAALGTVLGVFTGFVGLLFMPLAGAVAGELWARRGSWDLDGAHATGTQAARVGIATWLGLLVGTAVKLALVFMMIGVFVLALLV
jgi:uncharacterized protein YqgC (DUF456 family)